MTTAQEFQKKVEEMRNKKVQQIAKILDPNRVWERHFFTYEFDNGAKGTIGADSIDDLADIVQSQDFYDANEYTVKKQGRVKRVAWFDKEYNLIVRLNVEYDEDGDFTVESVSVLKKEETA